MREKRVSIRPNIIAIIVGAIIVGVGLAIGLAIGLKDDDGEACETTPEANGHKSSTGTYRYATVVADAKVCSDIGTDILARKGGNAVDATVAALLCVGVVNRHNTGIGGGTFFVIYDKSTGWHAVDSRETAPAAAAEDMFAAPENKGESLRGGMAVAVPGELKGLWEIQSKLGRLSWRSVVTPTVKLCQQGVPLSPRLAYALTQVQSQIDRDKYSVYYDANGVPKPVGTLLKMPGLARTFQAIADDPHSFYNGSLAADVVNDVKDAGGILQLEDLKNYKVKWTTPTNLSLPDGLSLYSMPPPGSGPVLSYILSILSGYGLGPDNVGNVSASVLTHHRILEAMKFAFGKRSRLGDEDYVDVTPDVTNMISRAYGERTRRLIDDDHTHAPDYYHPSFDNTPDHGTCHTSVIDGEGNAVSATGTINTLFGSLVIGERTGIVFNNEMDDFSTPNTTNFYGVPASPANFIRPGKRPMSSMCPAIVWDNLAGRVRMVTGASGGTKITTTTAMNIIDVLWLGLSLQDSVDRPRMHHQLVPDVVEVEDGFPQNIMDGLKAKGHIFKSWDILSSIQAIDIHDDAIIGTADYRKSSEPSGF